MRGRVLGLVALCAIATAALPLLLAAKARADEAPNTPVETDLVQATDVRVRMRAALVLGKKKTAGSRLALEAALNDEAWVVRVAVTAALGAINDQASLPAIETRYAIETEGPVKSELERVRDALHAASSTVSPATLSHARWIVRLGTMKDRRPASESKGKNGAASTAWGDVIGAQTRTQAGTTSGVVVVDTVDPALVTRASGANGGHHVAIVQMDGALVHLTQVTMGSQVGFRAQVEFAIRKLPEQILKGSLTGAATSVDDAAALSDSGRVARLQRDAVSAAVDSAMKNAERALSAAAK